MKINLDTNSYKKTVKVYCSKIKGEIDVVYIDVDTNETIHEYHIKDLSLGEHELNIMPMNGYNTVAIDMGEKEEEINKEEDIKGEPLEFDMDSLAKEFGISMEVNKDE